MKAVANTYVVGAMMGYLIEKIVRKFEYEKKNVHLIGHSLGAHISGFCGKKTGSAVGRITGLDPAGPGFAAVGSKDRLSNQDAHIVDIIHTDSSKVGIVDGFGLATPIGDYDFYPDGGFHAPGCGIDPTKGFEDRIKEIATTFRKNPISAPAKFAGRM